MRPETAVRVIVQGTLQWQRSLSRARSVFDKPLRRSFVEFVSLLESHGARRFYREGEERFFAPTQYYRREFGREDLVLWGPWRHPDGPGGLCLRICPAAWREEMRALVRAERWEAVVRMAPRSWALLRYVAESRNAGRLLDLLDHAEEMVGVLVMADL